MTGDWKLEQTAVAAPNEPDKRLLSGINLTFRKGAITLLVGHNGSGKSTLLESLAGLRRLSDGQIYQGDEPLWTSGRRKQRLNKAIVLRTGIALQQSESQWFASTVKEEFDYSLKPYGVEDKEKESRIASAMEQTGLSMELLGRDPWTLSGGQQRRLAMACLLACEPEWLLLDEPTAGLDADGIRRLCAVLDAHRAAGRGAVVATHDLDALLPLADEVAVIAGGSVREAAPAASWAVTHAHEAAAPQAQRALAQLRAAGFAPPAAPGGAPWPAPRELAALLAAQRAAHGPRTAERPSLQAAAAAAHNSAAAAAHAPEPQAALAAAPHPNRRLAARFDPRALIAAYLLLATTILLQRSWAGLAVAAALSLAVLIPLRAQIRPWMKAIRAYVIMTAVIAFIAGVHFSPMAFDWGPALQNIQRFSGLLLVMMLGLPLMGLVTPLRVQRSLEQTFGWMNRFKVPVMSVALTVTLIFRFIPLLAAEWERYVKIAHARGKATTPAGSLPFRMLLPAMVPYIRSLLRMAEQMADALEARGIGHPLAKPTQGLRLRFSREDLIIIASAAAAAILLLLVK
ncbi:ATP-binding cassette domain-containing protein [Paenibacillus glycanilyticus]|uniref:ATP-binding cassette domain-containing protein n=1 Tax=Paenibacillus glycanilyticus TaxID=126569 RepID=UPI00203F428B|nr:ATP-binding cassette domain-containing protein [Paenibacillus glycanilyticus]MCM3625863.1 ATP-binding cassette domain-containing protein [Paenibacillus glycanilyticus]